MPSKSQHRSLPPVPPMDNKEEGINVIIETPAGSRNKLKFEPKWQRFSLSKVLPAGAVFPFDFGFIPGTVGEDGDPLDILLLLDVPVCTGCIVRARLIGVLEAKQTEEENTLRNDRLLAVATHSKNYEDVQSIKDISKHLCKEIEHFFVSYNAEAGRQFKPLGFHGPSRAQSLMEEGVKRFRRKGKR